jgi:hypothetical protein
MSATTITFNGDKFLVDSEGRARKEYTPMRFYGLTPDVDVHETAALAVANPGIPQPILGRARDLRPRNARQYAVAM